MKNRVFDTACFRDLDPAFVKVARLLFLGHFDHFYLSEQYFLGLMYHDGWVESKTDPPYQISSKSSIYSFSNEKFYMIELIKSTALINLLYCDTKLLCQQLYF